MTEREALSDLVKAYRKVVGLEGAWDQELVDAEAVLKKEPNLALKTLTVDVIPVTLKYQVLHNMPKQEVYEIAKASEALGIFTFPVYTCEVERIDQLEDFSDMWALGLDYLVEPMYLQHIDHIAPYIEHLQKQVFGGEISG